MNAFTEKLKGYFARKGVGYYLTLPALAFLIAAVCIYAADGKTSFNPEINSSAVVLGIIAAVLCVAGVALDFEAANIVVKPIKYAAYLLCLGSFMWFVYSQATFIANVFVAIDGYTFSSPGFEFIIPSLVLYLLAALFILLSAILNKWQPWRIKSPIIQIVTDDEETGDAIVEAEVVETDAAVAEQNTADDEEKVK